MNQKIILKDDLLIGQGTSRKCYKHPYDKNLCIKVAFKDNKSSYRSMKREINYFKRLKKRKKSFEMISQYIDVIETDQGKGYVFELINDYDGSISKSIGYYLKLNDKYMRNIIIKLVEELRRYLLQEYILFSDLRVENILLQEVAPKNFKLIIIDGIGDNNQIPFLEYIYPLGIKKSIKKWEKLRHELIVDFSYSVKEVNRFNTER